MRRVPVEEIRPGHTTWRYDAKDKLVRTAEIKDYFPRGGPCSLDPAFRTRMAAPSSTTRVHELVTGTPMTCIHCRDEIRRDVFDEFVHIPGNRLYLAKDSKP